MSHNDIVRRAQLDMYERGKGRGTNPDTSAEVLLDAREDYVKSTIRETIAARRGGGSISFEPDGVVRVLLPDLSPEVVSVREAIRRGWL
jgi:hypothetical protein